MSVLERREAIVGTTRSLKRKSLSDADEEDFNSLANIFKRIKTAVPRTPYILSTPSLHPYRYHSQQEASAWMMGRLWRHDDEHAQYRTYLYREPCQDCFELQAGDDEEPEPERAKSRTLSTSTQIIKKKLNLSAFKVKQANGTITPEQRNTSPNLAPTKHISDQVNGVKKPEKPSALVPKPEPKPPKRPYHVPRDAQIDMKVTEDHAHAGKQPPPSSPQKSESTGSKHIIGKLDATDTAPHGLPPLLSPVHEPLGNPYGLPNILSPTLPSNVQAELDRLETQRKRAESNASTSSSDRKSQTLAVPNAQSQKPNGSPNSEVRVRSVSVNGRSPNSGPTGKPSHSSLVIKLKIPKAKASIVRQILRLPPKRSSVEKKEPLDAPKEIVTEGQSNILDASVRKKKPIPKIAARRGEPTTPIPTSVTKPAASAPKVAEKRPRTDDDASLAVPSKRPRAHSNQDRPVTPLQQAISSPTLSNKSSAQRSQSQYATPKKDPKAVSMLRTASAESYDSTPGRSGTTPTGIKHEARAGPTSAPLMNKKQTDISLLTNKSMKLNLLGRTLKHEATKILTATGTKITQQDEKRAAVINLECILSYMAAYYAQDLYQNLRGRPGEVEQTWKTLLPLCLAYARSTKDFLHLDGLRSYLSSMIASAICTHISQRGSVTRAHDSPQDVAHAELAKQHTSLVENFAMLSDHNLKMNRHYQDARITLPMEDLQTIYKKTYAAREANAKLAREAERINGTRMSGPYFLPLSMDTTPIQAVRFGLKFLSEYCEIESLDYKLHVDLDKAE